MKEITRRLSEWYKNNKRELPWRQTSDPYYIWLSEVILQQTRIQQGLNYYIQFAKNYPTVFELAKAPIDEVLKLWQGLGYYTRARNLHTTAQTIVQQYNGVFPDNYSNLLKLKGVGEYTAAAIASIAFGESVPVVDGNVARVISRLFLIEDPINSNIGKKKIKKNVDELIDIKDPGTFNQAMMEFGSLQCTPQNPTCNICTLNNFCAALKNNKVDSLPKKTKLKPQQIRYFHYLVITDGTKIILRKRNSNDIWEGLYEFPLHETKKRLSQKEIINTSEWLQFIPEKKITVKKITKEYKHILSHRILKAKFLLAEAESLSIPIDSSYFLAPINEIEKYAVPRLIDRFLKEHNYIV